MFKIFQNPNIDWESPTEQNESPIDQNYDTKAKKSKKSEHQQHEPTLTHDLAASRLEKAN